MTERRYIKNDEEAILKFKNLYKKFGYRQYKMNKFEEYDLYAENKNFLLNSNIITFTDLNGKLMALKPDVTLSIAKNVKETEGTQKLYYNENVYRARTVSYTHLLQLSCSRYRVYIQPSAGAVNKLRRYGNLPYYFLYYGI